MAVTMEEVYALEIGAINNHSRSRWRKTVFANSVRKEAVELSQIDCENSHLTFVGPHWTFFTTAASSPLKNDQIQARSASEWRNRV